MNARLFKAKDSELMVLMENFIQAVTDHQVDFGLSNQDVAEIIQFGSEYSASLVELLAAFATYKSALTSKDAAREALVGKGRRIARKIYANPPADIALISLTGLSIYDTGVHRPHPNAPTELIAEPEAGGTTLLKWNGNGNTRGVTYRIEELDEKGSWRMIDTTTKHRIVLRNQAPGIEKHFRVRAVRRNEVSPPSTPVVVYPEFGAEMRLAA